MGGLGSGNRWVSGRNTVESCRQIDVRRWAREGMLQPGYWGRWQWTRDGKTVASIRLRAEVGYVELSYMHTAQEGPFNDVSYPVSLETTPCRYGGTRYWFRCPARGCGRRVAILYLGGRIFACRHCYRLAYVSARENAGDRATRRADKIREQLGWEPGILNGEGGKPKWMRWRTFEELQFQANAFTSQSVQEMRRRFGLFRPDL